MKYLIYGEKDNGNPNVEIFFIGDTLKETREVYKKHQTLVKFFTNFA